MTDEKEESRAIVAYLVEKFRKNASDYLSPSYNETQARTDFVTPLLQAFGWDVYNNKGLPTGYREVFEEATVEVGAEKASKKPDYELRLAKQRKLFVEAKKPSVRIDKEKAPAFQVRRYGYSASLPISVLTNFHQLAIYDCVPMPSDKEDAHVARLYLFSYEDFEKNFDLLWDLLSREFVYSGKFDEFFEVDVTRHGSQQFDDYFLGQVRDWRMRLAKDIHANTPGISPKELAYVVQLFLSRIVFLRICEDRDLEKYETLRSVIPGSTFNEFIAILRLADKFYNSGIFRLLDDQSIGARISDDVLKIIISELYYPHCPYTFAVVETGVLGEIYEQFLGEEIEVNAGVVNILLKPEVRESGGVVPTPRYIVNSIIERTVVPLIKGKSPQQLRSFTVIDPCCGSGIFLLAAFELIANHYLDWYIADGAEKHAGESIFEGAKGFWHLTFEEKRKILLNHIRGVDIDDSAVQVARLSLYLKILEDESRASLTDSFIQTKTPVLPDLDKYILSGNSLISEKDWRNAYGKLSLADIKTLKKVSAFSWEDAFKEDFDACGEAGFDAIIANPPYVRIQHITNYSPEEAAYYRNQHAPYSTAKTDNFDKYALFIERALSLLKSKGRLGVIVPNKFMSIRSGKALRILLTERSCLEEIVHFGVKRVFGVNALNYTCLLSIDNAGSNADIRLERVDSLKDWRYGKVGALSAIPRHQLSGEPWRFSETSVSMLFDRIRKKFPETLSSVAEIFVGLQTSADDVYIVKPTAENSGEVWVSWAGKEWPVERGILRSCLYDVKITAYCKPKSNTWMIFPYEFIQNAKGKTLARLIPPDDFEARFPKCFAYLKARRIELESRNITGGAASDKQWYQFGRSQSLTKFNTPKIILPALSTEPKYAYDEENTVLTGGGNGPYYLIRKKSEKTISNYYLLAILNHPLSEAFVRTGTSIFGGGYYSHGKQFIQGLPIPIPSLAVMAEIDELVGGVILALAEMIKAKAPKQKREAENEAKILKSEIEKRISAIFGLSEEDLEVAKSVPIPD